jgi:hypothetical protein
MKSIFRQDGAISSLRGDFKTAIIRLTGLNSLIKASTVTVSGDGGISAQILQDFAGTPYFTVFGTKVSTFQISCGDLDLIGCNARDSKRSEIVKIAARLKEDARNGRLSSVTMACDNGPIMSGHLINMDFKIERPIPRYTLTVVGVMGNS